MASVRIRGKIATNSEAAQVGRLGGLATVRSQSDEFLSDRAAKGGATVRTLHGADYFRFISGIRWKKKRKIPD